MRHQGLLGIALAVGVTLPTMLSAQDLQNPREYIQNERQIHRDKKQFARDQREVKEFESILEQMDKLDFSHDANEFIKLNQKLQN